MRITLLFCLFFASIKCFAYDFGSLFASPNSTVYINEKFEVDWGCSVITRFGETFPASKIEAKFFISKDQILDSNDVLLSTDVYSASSSLGNFLQRKYDVNITSAMNFPLGKCYFIVQLDPSNKLLESDETNNIKAEEFFLYTKDLDLSVLNTNANKSIGKDSTLQVYQSFFNSGSINIDSFYYKVSVSNLKDDFSKPLTTKSLKGTGTTFTDRKFESTSDLNLAGLGLYSAKFYVQWEIVNVFPDKDVDSKNNKVVREFSWNTINTFDPNSLIIRMINGRNDTIATCNAVIYDNGGQYDNYSNNVSSRIRLKPSEQGKIMYLKLEKDFSLFAFDDYLRFFDPDKSLTTPLKELYHINSGIDYAFYSTSKDGSLIATFRSDAGSNNKGFKIVATCLDTNETAKIPKTGIKSDTLCNGQLFDDGGFANFSASSNGFLTIYPKNKGELVRLDFSIFKLNSDSELSIFDGNTNTIDPAKVYKYTDAVGSFTATNPTGAVTIGLKTSTNTSDGVHIQTSCIVPNFLTVPQTGIKEVRTCDTIIYDNGQLADYLENSSGKLVIFPKDSTYPVQLTFKNFKTNSSTDFLKVYSGFGTGASLIGTYSGSSIPKNLESTDPTGSLTLEFISDGTLNAAGFNITTGCNTGKMAMRYKKTDTLYTCNSIIYDNGGATGAYKENSDDILTIYPKQTGAAIKLSFLNIDTESSDYIRVYDSKSISSNFLNAYYGSTLPKNIISTYANGAITLRFTSDYSVQRSGFAVKAECYTPASMPVNGTKTIRSCDTIIYDNGGYLAYDPISKAELILLPTDTTKKVYITTTSFDLSNNQYLRVYGGTEQNTNLLLGAYSRYDTGPKEITGMGNKGALTLAFESNGGFAGKGFEIKVSCNVPTYSILNNDYKKITTCDYVFYDNGGPNGDYSNYINGAVTLTPAIKGAKLQLEILELDILDEYDALKVYYSSSAAGVPNLSFYNGKSFNGVYKSTSSDGKLTLSFNTDNTGTGKGFISRVSCDVSGLQLAIDHNETLSKTIAIYPNPNKGQFSIQFDGQINKIRVFSILGDLVIENTTKEINLPSNVHAGIYIMEIESTKGELFRKPFIVE